MVRVHLYEVDFAQVKIPLFKTVLVGWNEFLRLYKAGLVIRMGKTYGMVDNLTR